jgi:hypothetical protein
MKIPLTTSFRATTVGKAILLQALIGSLIAAMIVEMRLQLRNEKSAVSGYAQSFFNVTSDLSIAQKFMATLIVGGTAAFIVYNLAWATIAFGGGLLAPGGRDAYF